jgi:hypothetical protein
MVGLVAVLSSPTLAAETLTIANTNDSGPGSLREAIALANPGDTITFSPNIPSGSTITLTSGRLLIDKDLTIQGPGADKLAVSGNNASRVFVVVSPLFGTDVNPIDVSISGLTIKEGLGGGEGGEAGGIQNFNSTLTLTNVTVTNNTARSFGGGIDNYRGTLRLINSTISNNTAMYSAGGGITVRGDWQDRATLTINNSTISNNSANGGVSTDGESIDGGGICTGYHSTLTINNSTISNNSATEEGGGIWTSLYDTLTMNNSTISNNSASEAGGIRSDGGTATLSNTIVAGNTTMSGDSLAHPDVSGTFTSQGHNLIGNAEGSTGFTDGQNGDLVGTAANPIGPKLGPLQDNGGPTQTHALLLGSPAIDKAVAVEGITTDQRGVARPQGAAPDIGAFELVQQAQDTTPPKVTSTIPTGTTLPVAPTINVKATFSEDMQSATVKKAFKLFKKGSTTQIAAVVSYDAATDTATLNPTNNLRRGVTYKAVVTTVAKDLAGNQLDQDPSLDGPQQMKWFFTIRS